jgi:hypothetical protein
MSCAAHRKDFGVSASDEGASTATAETAQTKVGILRRIYDATMMSRQRQLDRQIARFIAGSGGKFTDDLEREITRRVLTSSWSATAAPFTDGRFP